MKSFNRVLKPKYFFLSEEEKKEIFEKELKKIVEKYKKEKKFFLDEIDDYPKYFYKEEDPL